MLARQKRKDIAALETVGADWECGDEDRGQAAPREGWAAPSMT